MLQDLDDVESRLQQISTQQPHNSDNVNFFHVISGRSYVYWCMGNIEQALEWAKKAHSLFVKENFLYLPFTAIWCLEMISEIFLKVNMLDMHNAIIHNLERSCNYPFQEWAISRINNKVLFSRTSSTLNKDPNLQVNPFELSPPNASFDNPVLERAYSQYLGQEPYNSGPPSSPQLSSPSPLQNNQQHHTSAQSQPPITNQSQSQSQPSITNQSQFAPLPPAHIAVSNFGFNHTHPPASSSSSAYFQSQTTQQMNESSPSVHYSNQPLLHPSQNGFNMYQNYSNVHSNGQNNHNTNHNS